MQPIRHRWSSVHRRHVSYCRPGAKEWWFTELYLKYKTENNASTKYDAIGKIPLAGGRQAVKYNAAWLFGASQAADDHTLRLQVEYEF